MRKTITRFLVLFTLIYPVVLSAQDNADTLSVVDMEELIITADRYESIRSQSTGAISVLKSTTISQLAGVQNLGGTLQHMPGFAILQLDGIGYDVQPIVRGFYGGGEAEYVLLMVDGQPINALETGLVNWDQIPLAAIESIEILRGGASSLYGDAAIGGVINIVTDSEAPSSYEMALAGGSFGTYNASGSARMSFGARKLSAYGNYESTEGYREHANRTLGGLGLGFDLIRSDRALVTLSGSVHQRNYDIPGPLTSDQIAQDRLQQSPFFQFDNNDESTQRLALQGRVNLGGQSELRGSLVGNRRTLEGARTLPLTPEYADVKWREFDASRLFMSAQWVSPRLFAQDRLTIGTDLQNGQLDVAWYNMATGTAETFDAFDGARGDLSATGDGSRRALAAYAQYDIAPTSWLRLLAGIRYDRVRDTYSPEGSSEQEAVHTALSPKVGVNARYVASARHIGNWYANVARSFKTATLDQLFGQRLIPFGPNLISISNSELKPQRGVSFETGFYHRAVLIPGSLNGEISLSVYQMDMEDELDVNLQTFQYENIATSRHRGIEMGLQLERPNLALFRLNYTLQNVTYLAGENKGNFVKAIPRDHVSAAISIPVLDQLQAMATLRSTRRTWLNDKNSTRLENFSSVDFKVTYTFDWIALEFETMNLLNNSFNTTGFISGPEESETIFLYPAAGRAMQAGIRVQW
ncbi:MAG: TonB-dependent receptor [Rhodothermaceae bacterium]|nr:TonB-dependent receptor [Rhodothermaceae bacterium]MYG69581.1 TonB-dependent receptor [Rhodothermaceae bacterium]MYJ44539.1 TonB-dependent receptor [Rhodothermaceae bacterium]